MKEIKKGGGTATLRTVSGDTLMAMTSGNTVVLRARRAAPPPSRIAT